MRGGVWLGILVIAACGGDDDVPWPADDGPVDAPEPTDAPMDCCIIEPPPRLHGRILLYEVDVLDPETDASFGQGLLAEVAFRGDAAPQPVLDTNPGTPFGCKVWVLNRTQAIAARGHDEGAVTLELPGLKPPQISTCSFVANTGYECAGVTAVTAGLADPGMMPDLQPFEVQLTAGVGTQVPPFTATAADVGDDFTLPPAHLALLENIPRDGTAFTVGCDLATCPNTTAIGTELEIITTDAPITGLSPFAMPLPTSRSVVIRCAEIAMPILGVPAVVSAHLATSNATRIQATYRRAKFAAGTPPDVLAMAGHAVLGISD